MLEATDKRTELAATLLAARDFVRAFFFRIFLHSARKNSFRGLRTKKLNLPTEGGRQRHRLSPERLVSPDAETGMDRNETGLVGRRRQSVEHHR